RSRDSDVAGIGEEDDDHDALRLLLHLVENGNAQDLGHVVEQIPRLSFDELQQLIDPLLDMARRLLWAQTGVRLQGLVRRLSMSPDPSAADRFVSGLINPPPTEPAALEGGLSAAAGLLMETLIHQPTAYPRTAVALSANVPVTLEVLVQLSGSEEQAALVAGPQQVWPHLPPVLLHALQVSAAQKRDTVRHAEFEEYARYGRCCVRALLEISANQGRLSRAMEGFLDWLYAERGFHDAGTYWSGKLSGLVTDEPGLMGILDALLLMTGAGLKWMTQVPPEGWQAYQDGFVHTWRLDWPSIESMKSRLAEHLGNVRWDGYDDRADNVLVLLGKLFPDGDLAVYQALEYGLAASSDLSRSPRAERWLADRRAGCAQPPLSQHRKPAHPRGQSDEAKAIAPSTPAVPEQPRQVDSTTTAIIRAADYIGQALNRGDSWEQISDALTKGGCFNDHLIAAGIIERLPGIVAPHRPLNLGRQWASQLMEELCGGQCGPEPAQKLIRHYLREIADDLSHRLDQLEMIEKATNGDWHAAEVPLLNELQERIESLGALAKPKQKGGLRIPRPRLIRSSRSGDDPG
ncbi:MAG: hypothetical protein JWL97_4267, partial [Gemmatimonadales bacterium]|nr:hypothetical protein [Gemmatimonadales bacterium]